MVAERGGRPPGIECAARPARSLPSWALTAGWPPLAGLGRGRFLSAALLASGLLALLRLLPRHEVPPPPGWTPPPTVPPPARPGLPPPRAPRPGPPPGAA